METPCENGGGDNYTMPVGVIASTHSSEEWEPREKDLKRYIHFDRQISPDKIKKIANDPNSVAAHPFFPLLRFHEEWTKFRKGNVRIKKARPLRYASRIDAAIYARYRSKLSQYYEAELIKRGLEDIPVAYRKISKIGGGNKSNIEIARDVFDAIKTMGDVTVTVVDIKSYFESLDHQRINDVWQKLIGSPLPPDHLAVFSALTKYSIVDVDKLFERLNLEELSPRGNRAQRRKRGIDSLRDKGFRQICSPGEFRELVAGSHKDYPSLIQKNGFDFGIPQGTPISDIIANMYLIDFDDEVNSWVTSKGGLYRRYSDDIIIVIPKIQNSDPHTSRLYLQSKIKNYGKHLRIQDKKVCIVEFEHMNKGLLFNHIFGDASKNGLEFLGFEFDGTTVKLRNSTLSNAWRKMKKRAYGHASRFVKRYRSKGRLWIYANFPRDYLEKDILQNVTFNQDTGFETWTFVKYVRRASRAFIDFEAVFSHQTKRYRRHTKLVIEKALHEAIRKHT